MQEKLLKNNISINANIWNDIYKNNNSILELPNEHFARIFYRRLSLLGPDFLDWGIGSGNNAKLMTKLGKNVFGTEVSIEAIKHVERMYKEQFNQRITIDLIKNNKLRFDINHFDCIISWQVQCYNNCNTFKIFLEESYRCLKPNGLLVFTLTDLSDLIFEDANQIDKNTYVCNYKNQKGVTLFAIKEPSEINNFITKFSVDDIGFFSYQLDNKKSKHWVFILKK